MKPDIEGLLFGRDGDILYNLAIQCDGNAIEIGSYRGASTVIIAQGLIDGNGGMLFAIDPYDNRLIETGLTGTGLSIRWFNRLNKWKQQRNIRSYGVESHITCIYKCSYDVANMFADDSIGMLFIDGDHTYPAIKMDLQMYIPKLKKGGILIIHDSDHSSVMRATQEEIIDDDGFSVVNHDKSDNLMSCIALKR